MKELYWIKRTVVLLCVAFWALPAKADEGMWLLPLLRSQQLDEMKALGLKLQDYDIYNPENASLKDAVVIFGGGCTGGVVSSDGLVLTNHHCGYGGHPSPQFRRTRLFDGWFLGDYKKSGVAESRAVCYFYRPNRGCDNLCEKGAGKR